MEVFKDGEVIKMTFNQKLIQRHKNPIGLLLRLISYIGIAISLWYQNELAIIIIVLIDLFNWFFMPMVKPNNEIEIVNKVVELEIDWIKSPFSILKLISIISGLALFGVLGYGLWTHNWVLLIIAFILIGILKQILLKISSQNMMSN